LILIPHNLLREKQRAIGTQEGAAEKPQREEEQMRNAEFRECSNLKAQGSKFSTVGSENRPMAYEEGEEE